MTPRLYGQSSHKRLAHKENQTKCTSLSLTRRSHVRILMYRKWAIGHPRVLFASVSKRVQVRSLPCENQFYSQLHSSANQTHFHMKGFALGLVLKQRQMQRVLKVCLFLLFSYGHFEDVRLAAIDCLVDLTKSEFLIVYSSAWKSRHVWRFIFFFFMQAA